ncbi:MAG: glycosyltransferase family 4 protein [Halorhabdus sp.]
MSNPSCVRVGVVGGTRLPGNVRTFLTNVRQLLSDHPISITLELIINEDIDVPDGYMGIDPGLGSPDRAMDTLKTLTSGLTAYATDSDPDLLFQVTKFPLHGCATVIAGRRTDTPVLTRFAGDNFREFRISSGLDAVRVFGLNNVVGRIPIHWSDRIIVLGPHGRSEITGRNDDVPIVEIPQPVDRGQFSPVSDERERELAEQFGFSTSERVLLTVGRLTERKGMDALIETAERLYERGEPFQWYVIGDGPMRDDLDATPGVEPIGRVDFADMPDYYRAVDLVVHPSRIEGLPNVLLEAAACGTPTVARDVGDSSLVASATFESTAELPALVLDEYDPFTLTHRFDDDRLRDLYADALVDTARQH